MDEVQEAAEFGAVEKLLILDSRLRKERAGEGEWDVDANELIRSVEQKGGDVTVFSSDFDPGRQLQNLGGVAALLRYRLDYANRRAAAPPGLLVPRPRLPSASRQVTRSVERLLN